MSTIEAQDDLNRHLEAELSRLRVELAEAHREHERLLAHAREVRGSRDVHSVYEVLDWLRAAIDAAREEKPE